MAPGDRQAEGAAHPGARGEAVRPFYRLLGITLDAAADGTSTVRLASRPDLENSRGDVHGGPVATLLDAAMSTACRGVLGGGAVATSTIAITYLAPGRGELTGSGEVVRAGRTLMAVTAEVRDASGVRTTRFDAAFASILTAGTAEPTTVVGGNNRTYDGYKVATGRNGTQRDSPGASR